MADKFPDKDYIAMEKMRRSGEWANCKKCDWHYKTTALERCPMCHHAWRNSISYQQPEYESPQL